MRISARKRVAFICMAVIAVIGAVLAVRHVRERLYGFEAARRANGDITILAYYRSFPNAEQVRDMARTRMDVVRAGIFSIWQVELETGTRRSFGLLKLATMDRDLIRQLEMEPHEVPKARKKGEPAELAIGEILAKSMALKRGDFFRLHMPKGESTEGATVQCRVSSVMNWGHFHHNSQLVYGDLSHVADFGLPLIGVEVLSDSPEERERIARDLTIELGKKYPRKKYIVMTLDELMNRTPPAPNSSQ